MQLLASLAIILVIQASPDFVKDFTNGTLDSSTSLVSGTGQASYLSTPLKAPVFGPVFDENFG